jgi:hypothetical protein
MDNIWTTERIFDTGTEGEGGIGTLELRWRIVWTRISDF